MKRACVVGVGLIGGSLGMALRRRGWRVSGVGRSAAGLREARRRGAVDEWSLDLARGAAGASHVLLAVPVPDIVPLARRLRPHLPAGTLVMDVGSVKGPVAAGLKKIYDGPRGPWFVGAHPMAGSEKTGVAHARADLFEGAACVVTPGPAAAAAARFWRGLGGRVIRMAPADHDRWMAMVSHLPHAIADALVLAAGQWGPRSTARALAAGSFRDMTRVAGADPWLWSGILRMNDRPVRAALDVFVRVLRGLAARRWPTAELKKAKKERDQLP